MKFQTPLFLLILIFSLKINAQNIIQNGDFETYTDLPERAGQIERAPPWIRVTRTPDYVHSFGFSGSNWAPHNGGSYNGQGFVGLVTTDGIGGAEAISQDVSSNPIERGRSYEIGFAYKSSNSSSFQGCDCKFELWGINQQPEYRLSAHISEYQGAVRLWQSAPLSNQNWATTSANFIAIDNFDFVVVTLARCPSGIEFLYIDDLYLRSGAPVIQSLPPDISICGDSTFTLDVTNPNGSYLWQDGSTLPTFEVTDPGEYSVQITVGNQTIFDTISVDFQPPINVDLGNDTTLCQNELLILDVAFPGASYQWQDQSTQQFFSPNQSGTYFVTVSQGLCTTQDSIEVTFQANPEPNLGTDQRLCEGDTLQLFANVSSGDILWSNGSEEASLEVTESGEYQIEVSVGNCIGNDTVNVDFEVNPNPDLGDNLTICSGDTVRLESDIFNNYQWSIKELNGCDTCRNVSFQISIDTTILLEVSSDLGCSGKDSIAIFAIPSANEFRQIELCSNDTIEVNGVFFFSDTLLSQKLVSTAGCDSFLTLEIMVRDTIFEKEEISICSGDTVFLFGNAVTRDTILTQVFTNSSSCDSTRQVEIKLKNSFLIENELEFCEGDTAFVLGKTITETAMISEVFNASNGCDSIVIFDLLFYPKSQSNDNLTFCEGDTARVFGLEILRDTTVSETIQSINGCDSTHTIDIFFNQKVEMFEQLEFCAGDTAFLFGNALTEDDTVFQIFTSAIGCDSTHNIDVVFLAEAEKMVFDSLCTGDILLFFNDTISETGTYFQTVPSIAGSCDTNYVLTAEFFENPVVDLIVDTLISIGESFEIPLNISDSTLQIIWQPNENLSCENCSNPTVSLTEATTFEATITNERGCSVTARIDIRVVDDNGIYIPTGFSPNGDSNNDFFTVFSKKTTQIDQLQIFDRWGGLLFELNDFDGNDPTVGWDGTTNGTSVDSGVYLYKFLIKNNAGQQEIFAGDITIVR